ncbi:MAG: insulinase family protein, partial [Massilia sp.]
MATSRFCDFSRFPRLARLAQVGAAALLLAAACGARAELVMSDPIPLNPQVKAGTLPNGLTYYIQKNARPARMLELRLVVKAGSLDEDDDQQGLAHLVEHMGFNGSTHFKRSELVSFLESTGVKMGADLNANTSFERTIYILSIPTDQPDNVEKGLTVLEDWAGGMTLADADIERERAIVLEEMRVRRRSDEASNTILRGKIYRGSNLPARLPIGDEALLKRFAPEAARRFYRDWYRPELMAVVAVGDIEPAQLEKAVAAHFGHLANPPNPRAPVTTRLPRRGADDSLVSLNNKNAAHFLQLHYAPFEPKLDSVLGDLRERWLERLFARLMNERLRELQQQPNAPSTRGSIGLRSLEPRFKEYVADVGVGPAGPLA